MLAATTDHSDGTRLLFVLAATTDHSGEHRYLKSSSGQLLKSEGNASKQSTLTLKSQLRSW